MCSMNNTRYPFSVLQRITSTAVLLLAMALPACAQISNSLGDSWKEEVLLHDGQKIIVERSQTYGGRHEIGQSPPVKEHTIRFSLPGSSQIITWTSPYGEELGRTNFNLLALHIQHDTPYLVSEPNLCLSYNKWGRPNPPYVFFKYDGSAWQRIAISEVPIEFKTINLIVNNTRASAIKESTKDTGYVPFEVVKKFNSNLRQPEYKTILRGPINYDPECIEMVTNGNGRWLAAARFSRKPSLEVCEASCRQEKFDDQHCPCKKIFEGK